MSAKLPRITADELIKALKNKGFILVNQRGSHQKWKQHSTGRIVIVAYHRREIIRPKTLKTILNAANISIEEFRELI